MQFHWQNTSPLSERNSATAVWGFFVHFLTSTKCVCVLPCVWSSVLWCLETSDWMRGQLVWLPYGHRGGIKFASVLKNRLLCRSEVSHSSRRNILHPRRKSLLCCKLLLGGGRFHCCQRVVQQDSQTVRQRTQSVLLLLPLPPLIPLLLLVWKLLL